MLWIKCRDSWGIVDNLWEAGGVLWIKNRIEASLFSCTELRVTVITLSKGRGTRTAGFRNAEALGGTPRKRLAGSSIGEQGSGSLGRFRVETLGFAKR